MFSSGVLSAQLRPIDIRKEMFVPHAGQAASAGRKEKLLDSQKLWICTRFKEMRVGSRPVRGRVVGASALTQSSPGRDCLVLCD